MAKLLKKLVNSKKAFRLYTCFIVALMLIWFFWTILIINGCADKKVTVEDQKTGISVEATTGEDGKVESVEFSGAVDLKKNNSAE